jgi:hypothetical protein
LREKKKKKREREEREREKIEKNKKERERQRENSLRETERQRDRERERRKEKNSLFVQHWRFVSIPLSHLETLQSRQGGCSHTLGEVHKESMWPTTVGLPLRLVR